MSRLQQLVFGIRRAWLHHQIDALKRRHAREQRRRLNRPYTPSAHLVPRYIGGDEPLQAAAADTAWIWAAALVVAFAAGVLFASVVLPAAPTQGTEYETHQQ